MKFLSFAVCTCALTCMCLMSACHHNTTTSSQPAHTASMGAVNDTCVCGHALGNSPVFETYKGKKIAFCCEDCKAKFDAKTPAEKDTYVSKLSSAKVSMGAMNDHCPLSGMA